MYNCAIKLMILFVRMVMIKVYITLGCALILLGRSFLILCVKRPLK
jgi:hypothetical protein